MSRASSHPGRWVVVAGSVLLLAWGGPLALGQGEAKEKSKSRLDGAWRLVSSKDPSSGQLRAVPQGIEMTKLLVGGRFAWAVVQDGKAIAGAGGQFTVEGDTYTETVTYAVADNQQPLVGKSFKFTAKVEGGKWHHTGTLKVGDARQEIDEVWERIP
jgi:hypothetical protein